MRIELDVQLYKRTLQSRLEFEVDSTVRRNLHIVLEHFDREIAGDLEGVMATLAEQPIYHLYNLTNAARQILQTEIEGSDAVRNLYSTGIAEGTLMLQELNPRWLIADTNGIAFDASAKLAFSGNWLSDLGYKTDAVLNYLYEGRLCAFIMINDKGKLIGEDVYFDPAGFEGIVDRPIDRSARRL
jgi:hypothetical protein